MLTTLERTLGISIHDEIRKNGPTVNAKAGEVIEIPVTRSNDEVVRVLLVGIGSRSESDIRKAGTSIGRKVRGNKSEVVSFLPRNAKEAQIHFIASGLATYSWSQKTSTVPETPSFTLVGVASCDCGTRK